MRVRSVWWLLAVVTLSAHGASGQGLYWESQTTIPGRDEPTVSKAYAVPKRMKVIGEDGTVTILRADREMLIIANPERKAYSEFPFDQLEKGAKATHERMVASEERMRAQMDKLPPEQRAAMEKGMQARGRGAQTAQPPPVEITNAGETKKIGGYECTKFVATANGETVLVAWTAKDIKGFGALRADWNALQTRFASLSGHLDAAATARSKLDGFPMETEAGAVRTVVTVVETRAIPDSEFEVPADYKKEPVRFGTF
jgi:hypothetical protein